ncbi:hypothetical protein GCM10027044_29230 [Hymenobacter ruber]
MPSLTPAINSFLARLRTVKEYAVLEGISVVQVHRRINEGKAEGLKIRGHQFVVLALAPNQSDAAPSAPGNTSAAG